MNNNENTVNLKIREDSFRLLSVCFYEPQKDIFIEEKLFQNLTEGLSNICPEAAVFSSAMEESLNKYSDEELNIEYAKLFVGPFELLAPPYGSVYLDQGERVMGDSTMAVIDIYQREGLAKSDDFKDLPDHIAVEMEFMSYLLYKERAALESADEESSVIYRNRHESFLNTFIRPWISPFCKRIKKGTNNDFYTSLADCASAFITA